MIVGRSDELQGDQDIYPAAGEYGKLIAWSDGSKQLHGSKA